jgi:hypothetical protein
MWAERLFNSRRGRWHGELRPDWTHFTIGYEATDGMAVVAVIDDFIADLGKVAGTNESERLSRGNAEAT